MKKFNLNEVYKFTFAGQELKGRFLGEKKLHSGDVVYRMIYNNCVYPVNKKDIL